MIFDRGYDDNKLIDYIDKNGDYFVIRMNDKRNFLFKGRKKNCYKEAIKRKGKVTFQDVKYGDDYLLKIVVTEWKTKQKLIFPNDLRKYGYDPDEFLIAKAVAMSCSLPILFSVYQVEGFKFVDGGLTDNFPIELVIDGIHPVIGLTLKKNSKKIFHHSVDIIYIDSLDVKVGQFKKGLNKRSDLYNAGYMSIKEYFEHKKRK